MTTHSLTVYTEGRVVEHTFEAAPGDVVLDTFDEGAEFTVRTADGNVRFQTLIPNDVHYIYEQEG